MGKRFLILTLLAAVLLACGLPIRYVDETRLTPQALTSAAASPLAPSLTPFQPLAPTTTAEITLTPSLTPEPSATPLPSATPFPTPWMDRPNGQVNIVVLGTDERPGAGFRTDVIIWLSLNPSYGTASILSLPRDLYVRIPGHADNRINVAHAFGFQTLSDTFAYNFGVRPDHYILTNFTGFLNIVDSLGGIDVEAGRELTDKCDLPQAVNGYCTIPAGMNHMDAQTALWYVRARYTTSDFNRAKRSQEVLMGLFRGMLSINAVANAPTIYEQYRASVQTDMSLQDILPLVPLAAELTQPDRLRHYNVSSREAYPYTVPETGADVLMPNLAAIQSLFYLALTP
jgi:LCP family protein required for cell wall assembly